MLLTYLHFRFTEPTGPACADMIRCGQVFGTPKMHPKSQPFIDHVMTFSWLDQRIWFRNYQIVEETGALAEIGPRFVLNPVKVFSGSFQGEKLWENPHFVSPTSVRTRLPCCFLLSGRCITVSLLKFNIVINACAALCKLIGWKLYETIRV